MQNQSWLSFRLKWTLRSQALMTFLCLLSATVTISAQPTVEVLRPNSTDRLQSGTIFRIQWRAQGIGNNIDWSFSLYTNNVRLGFVSPALVDNVNDYWYADLLVPSNLPFRCDYTLNVSEDVSDANDFSEVFCIEPLPGPWTNLVINGSFEMPFLSSDSVHVVPAAELLPWHTTEEAFSIWPSIPTALAAEGRQHVEVVSIWQTVPTIWGLDYRLSFSHSPRPGVDSALRVSINGSPIRTFVENGNALTGFNWKRYGTNFTAGPGNSITIRFDGIGVAGNAHIDDVRLERLAPDPNIRVSEVEVCWPTVPLRSYQVQYRSTLTTNRWINLLAPIQGNGETNCINDPVAAGEPRRFYRVFQVGVP